MTAEQAFLTEIGGAYLARAQAPDAEALQRWQPAGLVWPLVRDFQSRVAGMRKQHAEIDGLRFVWLEGGNARGTPVVLLHGFGASKENWLPLLPFLARRHRLFIPDLPGWGESRFRFGDSYAIDRQVARIGHWLEKHVPGPAHIVGSSMGGLIAGFTAARHPERVESLTLMNAAGVRGTQSSEFEDGLLQGRNALVTHSFSDVFRLFTIATERNRHLLAAMLGPLMSGQMIHRRHVNTHMFHQLLEHPPAETLPGVTDVQAPTLVLWGEQDRVLHVSCADTFQALIPHASVHRLRGIGHLPMVEAPAVTARCLHRFWREQTRAHRSQRRQAS
ncbi:MAG: alpha/beta fold hydrolase [Pseudomonadota bacterium]